MPLKNKVYFSFIPLYSMCYVVVQSTTNPTFRSKFSDFMVFSVINFQFNTNLLNFYTEVKANIVYLETKMILFNFYQVQLSV